MLHSLKKHLESAYYLLGLVLGTNYGIKSCICERHFRYQQTLRGKALGSLELSLAGSIEQT